MSKFLFPSSFKCSCGNVSHFSENTIREMKRMSKRKRVKLGDDNKHYIIFYKEKATEIICPKLGKCEINDYQ